MSLNENLLKVKQYFRDKGVALVVKRDSEVRYTNQSISSELLLQVHCAIHDNLPHKSKVSKTKLIEERFENVFSDNVDASAIFNSFVLYKVTSSNLKAKNIESEISTHGIYALLNCIKRCDPSLIVDFEEHKFETAFDKAIEKIRQLILEARGNKVKEFTPNNYFKSADIANDLNAMFP